MGACREGFNLCNKHGRAHFAAAVRRRRIPWRLVFEDTFMVMACAVLGHNKYNAADPGEQPDMACRRCHRWVK